MGKLKQYKKAGQDIVNAAKQPGIGKVRSLFDAVAENEEAVSEVIGKLVGKKQKQPEDPEIIDVEVEDVTDKKEDNDK